LLTKEEFLELAMLDFGLTDIPVSKAQRLWMLQKFLLRGRKDGKINVLIVDEAHKLSTQLLEEIRLLGNLEYGDEKLIQILLIGQSELDEVMNRPELWQLKQRISVRLAIKPLSVDDVEKYIQHRWTIAGGKSPLPFTPEALANIRKWSKGIPRLINSLCDNALTLAFADETRAVSAAHVETAATDLQLIEKAQPVAVVPKAPSTPLTPVNGTAFAVQPVTMKTMETYMPPARKQSVWHAMAGRLGWRRNGKNPAS
jgi:general secretion pathway protein A